MWRLKGTCPRCGRPMPVHILLWLQSFVGRILGRPRAGGQRMMLVKKALEFYDSYGPPVIVEPLYRGVSRHATSGVVTRSDLVKAFYQAQDVSPWVVLRKDSSGAGNSSTIPANSGVR